MEKLDIVILFGAGLVTTFVGAFTSGITSLLGMTLLMLFGFNPETAFVMFRLGGFPAIVSSFFQFFKSANVDFKVGFTLLPFGMIGAFLGSLVFLKLDQDTFRIIMIVAMVPLIPLTFFNRKLGVKKINTSNSKKIVGYLLIFLLEFWASFAISAGVLFMFVFLYFFGFTILQAKGTDKISSFANSATFLTTYVLVSGIGAIPVEVIPFMIGTTLGAWFGAKYAIKIGNKFLQTLLLVSVVLLTVKIIISGF